MEPPSLPELHGSEPAPVHQLDGREVYTDAKEVYDPAQSESQNPVQDVMDSLVSFAKELVADPKITRIKNDKRALTQTILDFLKCYPQDPDEAAEINARCTVERCDQRFEFMQSLEIEKGHGVKVYMSLPNQSGGQKSLRPLPLLTALRQAMRSMDQDRMNTIDRSEFILRRGDAEHAEHGILDATWTEVRISLSRQAAEGADEADKHFRALGRTLAEVLCRAEEIGCGNGMIMEARIAGAREWETSSISGTLRLSGAYAGRLAGLERMIHVTLLAKIKEETGHEPKLHDLYGPMPAHSEVLNVQRGIGSVEISSERFGDKEPLQWQAELLSAALSEAKHQPGILVSEAIRRHFEWSGYAGARLRNQAFASLLMLSKEIWQDQSNKTLSPDDLQHKIGMYITSGRQQPTAAKSNERTEQADYKLNQTHYELNLIEREVSNVRIRTRGHEGGDQSIAQAMMLANSLDERERSNWLKILHTIDFIIEHTNKAEDKKDGESSKDITGVISISCKQDYIRVREKNVLATVLAQACAQFMKDERMFIVYFNANSKGSRVRVENAAIHMCPPDPDKLAAIVAYIDKAYKKEVLSADPKIDVGDLYNESMPHRDKLRPGFAYSEIPPNLVDTYTPVKLTAACVEKTVHLCEDSSQLYQTLRRVTDAARFSADNAAYVERDGGVADFRRRLHSKPLETRGEETKPDASRSSGGNQRASFEQNFLRHKNV